MNIGNIFSRIPSLINDYVDTYEETGPNGGPKGGVKTQGPAKYRVQTNGQLRRAQHRALKSQTKKARRSQLASYFEAKRKESILRSRLQHAGVLPYSTDFQPRQEAQIDATLVLVHEFGARDEDGNISLAREDVYGALQKALSFWSSFVGREGERLPEGFKPVIYA